MCVFGERQREISPSRVGQWRVQEEVPPRKKNVTNRLPVIFDCIKGIYNTNKVSMCLEIDA